MEEENKEDGEQSSMLCQQGPTMLTKVVRNAV